MIVSTHSAVYRFRSGELRLPDGLGAGRALHPSAVGADWLECDSADAALGLPTRDLAVDARGRFWLGEGGLRHRFAVEDGEAVQVFAWVYENDRLRVWARPVTAFRPPKPKDRPPDVIAVRRDRDRRPR